MSEYDATHVYVPIERLQFLRSMGDGEGRGAINLLQLRCREGANLDVIARRIHEALHAKWGMKFLVQTWEQKQGPLLAAVAIEQNILNILLFFIIAVAGFGILAIFSMIVVEKTRDIGILKALGASTSGVRSLFLGYGLGLGLVGSGVGLLGGLGFVARINEIEKGLSWLLGRKVFDDTIYYFEKIPTKVDLFTLAWIVGGAMAIAVIASIAPAERAARMDPARAVRLE
jgi:lipoprotein-releasing system permease protein